MSADITTGDADAELRQFVERIMRVHEDLDALNGDKKEIYQEAGGRGFNKTALCALVSELRKQAKNPAAANELASDLDLYREAYHRRAPRTYTREAAE